VNRFTAADGPTIHRNGTAHVKKPNPVWLMGQTDAFEVETNEGRIAGKAGDYLAYDPLSGHVWPVSAAYVAQHYERAPENAPDGVSFCTQSM
jgi:hypothetical protein